MTYIKIRSVTFWASMVPLIAGLLLATENFHDMDQISVAVRLMFGETKPHVLINTGVFGIGLRQAVGK